MPTCCSAWRHPSVQRSLHSRLAWENNQRSLKTRVSPACKSYQGNSWVSLGGNSVGYKSLGNNSSTATHIVFHYAFFTLELLAATGFHWVEWFTSEKFEKSPPETPRRLGWRVGFSLLDVHYGVDALTLFRAKLCARLATTAHSSTSSRECVVCANDASFTCK